MFGMMPHLFSHLHLPVRKPSTVVEELSCSRLSAAFATCPRKNERGVVRHTRPPRPERAALSSCLLPGLSSIHGLHIAHGHF
jgi:hypothetical protein